MSSQILIASEGLSLPCVETHPEIVTWNNNREKYIRSLLQITLPKIRMSSQILIASEGHSSPCVETHPEIVTLKQ